MNAVKDPQWRKKSWGLYIQDSWKVTRKFTMEYGLRWDYSPMGHEIHYRSSQLGVNTPNPSAGGLPGGYVYEGYGPKRCNCEFVKTYPYAIGPRLGLAYQYNSKTVLRAGWGISYSAGPNWAYVTGGSPALGVGYNSVPFDRGFGQIGARLRNGLTYNIADLYTATLDPGVRPSPGQLDVPPAWGPQLKDPNGGRPARVNQWNISVQRELTNDRSLDVAYVGNRGIWEEARGLIQLNAINPATLEARGIDIRNAADRTLLTSRIDSATAVNRGFRAPYAGFPNFGTVAQSLRPFPMYQDNLAIWWSPVGNSWYDALQAKFTKRYSHGLDMTAAFTWQKELNLGNSGVNDVFNRPNQKALNGSSQPLIFVTGFNYETPRIGSSKLIRQIAGGWTFGGILRYASGSLIGVPGARNNLNTVTLQNGGTRYNRVPGQPLFTKDPGCHCIDPNKDFVLNPNAWQDAPAGEWGFGAPFYNDYRWRRNVSEQLSVGRRFAIRERMWFQVRAEFFNAFNGCSFRTLRAATRRRRRRSPRPESRLAASALFRPIRPAGSATASSSAGLSGNRLRLACAALLASAAGLPAAPSAACAGCHQSLYDSYRRTPMASSSGPVEGALPAGDFTHRATRYRVEGSTLHIGGAGKPLSAATKPLTWYIGSGAAARSYVLADSGFLFEAPVAWCPRAAKWDLSPGYDRYAYPYLTRPSPRPA